MYALTSGTLFAIGYSTMGARTISRFFTNDVRVIAKVSEEGW